MRNSHSPISKKKRKANNFKPSTSLVDFALTEDINLFDLEATVAASTDLKKQYTRGTTDYYHISEIRTWWSNKVAANV